MDGPGSFPEIVEIVVEIPRGSRNKYEDDERAHVERLDQVPPHRLIEIRRLPLADRERYLGEIADRSLPG